MVTPWRVVSSRSVIADRWIDVRADDCMTAGGKSISPYYVLRYPDWVHMVALTPDHRLVLVEQYRHGAGLIVLELPGGAIDPADPDPEAAGRRELLEETGFTATHWRSVSSFYANPATHTNRVHTVLATGCTRACDPELEDGEEGLTVRCLPVAEVRAGLLAGILQQSMQVGALLLALEMVAADEATDGR